MLSGFLLLVLNKAVDEALKNAVDPKSNGFLDRVIQISLKPIGRDRDSNRKKALVAAANEAATMTINGAANPPQARLILELVDQNYSASNAGTLASELAKVVSNADEPDLGKLTELIKQHQPPVTSTSTRPSVPSEIIRHVLGSFVKEFRGALIAKPEYRYLIPTEQTKLLQQLVDVADPLQHEDEATYRVQMSKMYGAIDFVGIPDLPLTPSLNLDAQFLDLKLAQVQLDSNLHEHEAEERDELPVHRRSAVESVSAIDTCLTPNGRLVLLGEAGAGKTTLLRRLVSLTGLIDRVGRHPLPIYVPLREFAVDEHTTTLEQHIQESANRHLSLNLAPDFFHNQLESGNCIVCFDGIDEVSTLHSQSSIRDLINGFVSRFPHNTFVISSRPAGYDAPFDPSVFLHYRILPLDLEQIDEFVHRWYALTEIDESKQKTRSQELISLIHDDSRFMSISEIPLLLTIILLVHRNEADLPKERFKLYEKCVSTLLDTRNQQKGLVQDYDDRWFYRRKMNLLRSLAYEMQEQRSQETPLQALTEDNLLEYLAQQIFSDPGAGEISSDFDMAKQEATDFLAFVKARTGLLVEKSGGMLTFPHLTFQEYLAASYFDSNFGHLGFDEIWQEIEPLLFKSKWREVILLLIGILTRSQKLPTLFLERLLSEDEVSPSGSNLHQGLFLSGIALSDGIVADDQTHHKIIDRLLDLMEKGAYLGEGRDALEILRRLKGDNYLVARLGEMVRAWKGEEYDLEFAFNLLGAAGGEKAPDLLGEFIDDSTKPSGVRFFSAATAASLGRTDQTVANIHKSYVSGGRRDGRTIPLLARYCSKHDPFDFELLETLSEWASSNERGWVTGPALEGIIQIGLENENATNFVLERLKMIANGETSQRQIVHSIINEAGVALGGISAIVKKFGRDPNECLNIAQQIMFGESQNLRNVLGALVVVNDWDGWDDQIIQRTLKLVNDGSGDTMGRVQIVVQFGPKLMTKTEQGELLRNIAWDQGLDPRGRVWALGAYIRITDDIEESVSLLGHFVVSKNLDWVIRSDAADMLGEAPRGNKTVVAILRGVCADGSEQNWVRNSALSSLGRVAELDDKPTRILLKEIVEQNNDKQLQRGSYAGLKQLTGN